MEQFIASFKTAPEELVLDFDATDNPLHGQQEGRFFHGYYDCYCYLPLYVFCGQQLLVTGGPLVFSAITGGMQTQRWRVGGIGRSLISLAFLFTFQSGIVTPH